MKRMLAMMCALVLFLTGIPFDFNAMADQRVVNCGYEDHEHTPDCFDAYGQLICERHVHTDECYGASAGDVDAPETGDDALASGGAEPAPDAEEAGAEGDEEAAAEEAPAEGTLEQEATAGEEEIAAPATNEEDPAEETPGEGTLAEEAPTEDASDESIPAPEIGEIDLPQEQEEASDEVPEEDEEWVYKVGERQSVLLSEIFDSLDLHPGHVTSVVQMLYASGEEAVLEVEKTESDYEIVLLRAFDEADLAIACHDEVIVVKLVDGRPLKDPAEATEAQDPVEEPEAGSTPEEDEAYEKELEAWEELNLDDVTTYELDTEAAAVLMAEDGWTLNQDGDPFDPEKDEVRCKYIDGELTPLELTLLVPSETKIAESLEETFTEHLAEAGAKLTIEETDSQTLLSTYYRQTARDCDMIYLATNFDVVFDPSLTFRPEEEAELEETGEEGIAEIQNTYNTTGINDERLYQLAVDMRKTEPGDTLSYCQKWIEFQKRFAEVLPMIPIYSNVYFDFFPRYLQNYNISENVTWSQAIVSAFLSDASDEDIEEDVDLDINVREGNMGTAEEEEDENLVEIDD